LLWRRQYLRRLSSIYRQAIDVAKQCTVLCKENRALLAENEGLEGLVELAMAANDRNNGVICQYQSVLMHYNELQSRSAGVEEIYRYEIRAEGG
jgi:hypothetical protein